MLAPTITSPSHQSQLQMSEIQRCWKGQIPFESERSLHKVSLGKKQETCLEPVVPNSDWLCSSQDQTHNKSLKECKFHILADLGIASAYVGKPVFKFEFGRCAQCSACAYVQISG